jgi:hypothetical protein
VYRATLEKTLVRKRNVYRGTGLDWDGSRGTDADDCEWIVEETDAFGFIGSHVAGRVASQPVKVPCFSPLQRISHAEFFIPLLLVDVALTALLYQGCRAERERFNRTSTR